jgi:hypothetical protein
MRRLGVGGLDALQFDALDGLGNLLLERLQFRELPRLFEHHLVKLVVLMLEMGQVRLQFFQTPGEFFVHGSSLTQK